MKLTFDSSADTVQASLLKISSDYDFLMDFTKT